MGCFKILNSGGGDVTVVSNFFIDEYMKDANDAQIKVYLYLLRMMTAGLTTSVSDIADKFNHTEKDVLRALKYWEKAGLLSLEFDQAKTLCGILLLNPSLRKAQPASVLTQVVSLKEARITPPGEPEKDFAKPVYSLDQLREFKDREETSQLIFVAEQYLGKPLGASEIKTILFFTDKLGFSEDLIDYLIQYCVDKGKKDFRYIEKVAISWAEEGIKTPKQAAKAIQKYDKTVYDVMKALGKSGTPTRTEVSYAMKWSREYGFEPAVIQEACSRTVMATDKHRFEYADSILNSWYQKKVHHVSDIKALDEAYQKNRPAAPRTSSGNAGQFNQFLHNDYDFDALEKELISN